MLYDIWFRPLLFQGVRGTSAGENVCVIGEFFSLPLSPPPYQTKKIVGGFSFLVALPWRRSRRIV